MNPKSQGQLSSSQIPSSNLMQPRTQQPTQQSNQQQGQVSDVISSSGSPNITIDKIIGNGTFGVVYLAVMNDTNERVAIKKVFQDKRYKNREFEIIKSLNHANLIRLKQAYYTTQNNNPDEVYLNIVMEYVPETLSKVIRNYRKNKVPFPPLLLKVFSYQMFRALAYMKGIGICHRDIKPQNILCDSQNLTLKICDFGSAKKLVKGEPNVSYICSRYYRAPELIFSAEQYTTSIDTWSIGTVIAEMILGEPLFPGENSVEQLVEIIKILGTPTKEQVQKMNPQHSQFQFPSIKATQWTKIFAKQKPDPMLIDLISRLLVFVPTERPSPLETLLHPYFNELRTEKFYQMNPGAPDLLNFTPDEIKTQPQLQAQLVPEWYKKKQIDQLNNDFQKVNFAANNQNHMSNSQLGGMKNVPVGGSTAQQQYGMMGSQQQMQSQQNFGNNQNMNQANQGYQKSYQPYN